MIISPFSRFHRESTQVYSLAANGQKRITGWNDMNAAVAFAREVEDMSVEERVVKIESDIVLVRSTLVRVEDDIKSLRGEIKEVRSEIKDVRGEVQQVKNDLQAFKTDVAKEFGSVRKEIADAKAETAQQFGLVRAELEKLSTAIEGTKVWFLVTCFGAVFSGIGAVVGLQAFKLF